MDNYAFRVGLKRIIFDLFLGMSYPLAILYPQIFSAHIFGVLQVKGDKPAPKNRLDLGN